MGIFSFFLDTIYLQHFLPYFLYFIRKLLYNTIIEKVFQGVIMKKKDQLNHPVSERYHETKQHTPILFPYNVYPCTIPQDFPSVYLHWQDTAEIIYIKKGRGIAQVDLSVFEVQGGDIVFVPPGHLHGLHHLHYQRMEYENIIFDFTFLGIGTVDVCSQKYLIPLKQNQVSLPCHITSKAQNYRELSACLEDSDRLCDSRCPGYELGVKGNTLRFLSLLFSLAESFSPKENRPENTRKLKLVLQFLEEHYSQPVSVATAADVCGYSASHFMRWFKNITGSTFTKYLNGFRLEKAFLNLKSTDLTVLEIAENSGFSNLSNFNRQFKRQFHQTPAQVRKQHLSSEMP